MKKVSRVICKILAFSCACNLNSIKVAGMDNEAAIEDEQIERFLSNQKSHSVIEAMIDNDIMYLKRKGYEKVVRYEDDFPRCSKLQYKCYKKDSTTYVVFGGAFNELSEFLKNNTDAEMKICVLADATGLSLNVILCYLMTLESDAWSNEINDLMDKFSNSSESKLDGKDRKDKIDEIKSIALAFYFI